MVITAHHFAATVSAIESTKKAAAIVIIIKLQWSACYYIKTHRFLWVKIYESFYNSVFCDIAFKISFFQIADRLKKSI